MQRRHPGTPKPPAQFMSPNDSPKKVRAERRRVARQKANRILGILAVVCCSGAALFFLVRWWRTPTSYLKSRAIAELDANDPDAMNLFFNKYHSKDPVVIKGAMNHWPAMKWTPENLAARCMGAEVPIYAYDLQADDWAALRQDGNMAIQEYFKTQFGKSASDPAKAEDQYYALEMSLRSECPSLLEDIRIPKFFADDMLVRYFGKSPWPTLIVGPRGTRSGLHRDTHNFPFYMALFSGRKRFIVFDDSDPGLAPYYMKDQNTFHIDPFEPNFWRYQSLGNSAPYEFELKAGDLLYIPNGAPHAAKNLDDTIAISGNFLDKRSYDHHEKVTCEQNLWKESKLCWAFRMDFDRHKKPVVNDLKEISYYELTGHNNLTSWCDNWLKSLKDRASRREELKRNVPIVEKYCVSKSKK